MSDTVTWAPHDTTAVITLDDGKANALSPDVIAAVNRSLDEIEADDAMTAAVFVGRPGMFSGGFDLKVIRGAEWKDVTSLVTSGGELVLRLFSSPLPVVCACTGHAIAAGALLALGSHYRVGAEGDFRIGLIETQIGMVLPDWAVVIAEQRINTSQLQQAVVEARVYNPTAARDAGFLDRVVAPEQVLEAALEEAARLGGLDRAAYAGNLAKLRKVGTDLLADAVARDRAAI